MSVRFNLAPELRNVVDDLSESRLPNNQERRWLTDRGVPVNCLTFPYPPYSILTARVLHEGSQYRPCAVGDFAFLLPAIQGDWVVDLVAWSRGEKGRARLSSRLGFAGLLGEEQIGLDGAGTTGQPIPILQDPLDYLRSGRKGLVVVNRDLAAHILAGVHIQPAIRDQRLRSELERLVVPPPIIVTSRRLSERPAG